jgi:hypothetical protein
MHHWQRANMVSMSMRDKDSGYLFAFQKGQVGQTVNGTTHTDACINQYPFSRQFYRQATGTNTACPAQKNDLQRFSILSSKIVSFITG